MSYGYYNGSSIKPINGKIREKYDSYAGMKYNSLRIIEILGTVDGEAIAEVECCCGTVKKVKFSSIKKGSTKSCGCVRTPRAIRTKIGDEICNTAGDKAVVIDVLNANEITIRFLNTHTTDVCTQASIVKGHFKDRMKKSVAGIGYIGIGEYNSVSHLKQYKAWQMMLHRCYDERTLQKHPSYRGCSVSEEWHNFQNFAEWCSEHYVDGWELDKDLLLKGNKIYSPHTCVMLPTEINNLLCNSKAARGELPLGVIWHKNKKKYVAQCTFRDDNGNRKNKWLYQGDDPLEAFQKYKEFKEALYKKIAEKYKSELTDKAFSALMIRTVTIED